MMAQCPINQIARAFADDFLPPAEAERLALLITIAYAQYVQSGLPFDEYWQLANAGESK